MNVKKWIGILFPCCVVMGFLIYQHSFAQDIRPPNLTTGIKDKKKGDIIALQTDSEIVAWCAFDKAIVVTNTNVLCVYKGEEGENASSGGATSSY